MVKLANIVCDYLVVGAGAASMSFIDTMLTQVPTSKIVLVDKRNAPGGHWVDAYGYVKLHQPSIVYGIESKQLEGNWLKLLMTRFTLPWQHRASKQEILKYFQDFVNEKIESGQLQYFPGYQYDFDNYEGGIIGTGDNAGADDDDDDDDGDAGKIHAITSLDGKTTYHVKVQQKLVNGAVGECIIPSRNPVEFPIDSSIQMWTPNQLYDYHNDNKKRKKNKKNKTVHKNSMIDKQTRFVVLGCGKTAMDTIVYLQTVMKIRSDQIHWIIPNDVWMLAREGSGSPWSWPKALLDHGGDRDAAALSLEADGAFIRLDEDIVPTKFRFPVVGKNELNIMRNIPKDNIIRKGRVTSIRTIEIGTKRMISVNFGSDSSSSSRSINGENEESWNIDVDNDNDTIDNDDDNIIFVHCTSPGPFNGNPIGDVFNSENELSLYLLFAPPISISMSCIAMIEASMQLGTFDIAFGKQLVLALREQEQVEQVQEQPEVQDDKENNNITENDILCQLIRAFNPTGTSVTTVEGGQGARTGNAIIAMENFRPIITLGLLLALLDKRDPLLSHQWMQKNRLSFLSIPGFKCNVYEDLNMLIDIGKKQQQQQGQEEENNVGFTRGQIRMMELLQQKLKPLEGK